MTQTPYEAFIEFVHFDAHLLSLQKLLHTTEQQLHTALIQKKDVEQHHHDAHDKLHDMRRKVDMQERMLKELDLNITTKNRRLQTVSAPKEYFSVQQELEILHQEKQNADDALLALWSMYENQQTAFKEQESLFAQRMQEITRQTQELEQRIITLRDQLEQDQIKRNGKETAFPQEWLEKYTMMRKRVENPVVPVAQGSCSACFYPVNQHDLAAIERHKLLACKDCYRILYSAT